MHLPSHTTHSTNPARVLVTSAGSLLGRGILSTLVGRRHNLFLVGGDLNPNNPGCRDCDLAVPLPATHGPTFTEAVAKVVATHHIDLVIPGRDPDALVLASSQLPLAGSSAELVAVSRDKWLTYQWCTEADIPFAPTVATGHPESAQALGWPLPLIAKPRTGSGSLGVRVLHNAAQVVAALTQPGLVIQPFLDPPAELTPDLTFGTPLFWEVACHAEYGVQALVGPAGETGPSFCFVASHTFGRNDRLQACADPSLHTFAHAVVAKLAARGWRGPINLQARYSAAGWQLIEINPRFSGGTSGRYLLGFDEVGWVLNTWLGQGTVPSGPAECAQAVAWLPQPLAVARDA